jgi:hypothetical protein
LPKLFFFSGFVFSLRKRTDPEENPEDCTLVLTAVLFSKS